MRQFYFFFVFFFILKVSAQDALPALSETSEVSIITIGPGKNLYDKFGHSAVRVNDPQQGLDVVFNYGAFDFNTPNFYGKFAQGKLLYKLDTSRFLPFLQYYKMQNRWVKEQILDLTAAEKQEFFDFLVNNAKPQNRDYLYDFFFDNCATKPRDVLNLVLKGKLSYDLSELDTSGTSFRELIQSNVPANSWGSLGMDVAIGAVVDRDASGWEHQFLPAYVYEANSMAFISRNGDKKPLVKEEVELFKNVEIDDKPNFFTSPLFVFGIIGLLIIWRTYRDSKRNSRSRYLDVAIFALTGLIGVVLLLLWFATDHSATANNYNLLWAFPISLIAMLQIGKKEPKKWLRKYVILLILMLVLLTIHWTTGIQGFAIGFIPLFIALGIRYVYLAVHLKKLQASN